jgi:oligopeptide/dipeptide ABC transporter ATP-binding protein
MYAGFIMEITDTVTLFSTPRHPYTYGLIKSMPSDKSRDCRLEPIQGSPPDLGNLPPGCPFAPRCSFAGDLCTKEFPEMREVVPGHMSRCHYIEKMADVRGLIGPEGRAC